MFLFLVFNIHFNECFEILCQIAFISAMSPLYLGGQVIDHQDALFSFIF